MMKSVAIRDGANATITIDTETNAEDVRDGRGYCIGISASITIGDGGYFCHYFPIRHVDAVHNLESDFFNELRQFIESYKGWLIFHNAKFDLVSLKTIGIDYQGKFYDTMLMCHLINENFPFDKSLNTCVKYYVDKEESKKDNPGFKYLCKELGWGNLTVAIIREYAEHDAVITNKLFDAIIERFNQEVPEEYWTHKQKFTRTMIAMESRGVRIEKGFCQVMIEIGEAELDRIRKQLAGFNPGSSKDLKRLFIDKLGLPVVKLTKEGMKKMKAGQEFDIEDYASFDKEAMEEYDLLLESSDDPTAKLVLEYRGWQKTVSSNYRAYLTKVSPDGRLRPNYKLHGTVTGRCSCADPNLQQIPRSSEKPWNGNLKQAFVADDDFELWEFDYSQLELRLATAYADEKGLKQVFLEGRDIFDEMAAALGMTRQNTKTFVYSTQYGAGLDRLVHVFKITRAQAEAMRSNYYNTYPGFVAKSNRAAALCKASGKVKLWSGRSRHFYDRKGDAHKAFNSVIQGGSADIVEYVMVKLFERIDSDDCRMLLTVHDSVVFEIRKSMVDIYVPIIQELMEQVEPDFGVKFAVEGKKWGLAA